MHTDYTYNLNDTTVTVTPAPSGENAKTRQYEYDALGRLTSVCEVTGVSSAGCGQNNGTGTGYKTAYTYDPLGNLTQAVEATNLSGPQTRTFAYDGLSRMTSETNPESGTTSYTFDYVGANYCAAGVGAYSSPGNLVAKADANGNHLCYYYDPLHRLTAVGNNNQSATNPCHRFRYDNSTGFKGSIPAGITVAYTLGRMVEAATDNCGGQGDPVLTDEWFSYSARGENVDMWESTPNSGGWYHVQQGYFPSGVMETLRGFTGTGTGAPFSDLFTYNLDGKGRPYGMVDTTGSAPIWASTTYNVADQPTAVVQAAGGGETFQYDGNSGRMTQWQSTAGSNTQTGTLTWNANGTLQKMVIADTANTANGQTCIYGYDDLRRLLSANCGTPWSQTFSYDRFGNIWKYGSLTFNPASYSNNWANIFSYDMTGNVLNDGANTYTYDAEGRPVLAAGVQTTFDAFGRAVEGNNRGTYTQVVYSPTGGKYAYMNGSILNKYIDPMVAGMAAVHNSVGGGYFQHADWLGSSRFAATGGGTVAYDRAYAPFGEPYAETASTNRDFTGQTEDTTPGLYDFLYRQQSQSQGRWLVPDPAGLAAVDLTNPQTWNRYAYVGNNPNNRIDPSGTCDLIAGGFTQTPGRSDTAAQQLLADTTGANLAFPFSGQNAYQSYFSSGGSLSQEVLRNAITNTVAQSNGGATNLYVFSGSAGELAQVWGTLPDDVRNGITSITYFSPGNATGSALGPPGLVGGVNPFNGSVSLFTGNTAGDHLITGTIASDLGGTVLPCAHNANCEFGNQFTNLVNSASSPCSNQTTFTRQNPAGSGHGGHGGGGGGGGIQNPFPGNNGQYLWNLWLNWYFDQVAAKIPYVG